MAKNVLENVNGYTQYNFVKRIHAVNTFEDISMNTSRIRVSVKVNKAWIKLTKLFSITNTFESSE